MSEDLKHYGMPRRSGRYPWGSGKDPYQSARGFMGTVSELREQGMTNVNIAKGMGMSTTDLRNNITLARAHIRTAERSQAMRLREKGYSPSAIGRRMGKNESSIRSLLEPSRHERVSILKTTMDALKENIYKHGPTDVSRGTETHIGISREKLNAAVAALKDEGYKVMYFKVEQVGIPGQFTSIKVIGKPDSDYGAIARNMDMIMPFRGRSEDHGRTLTVLNIEPPKSVASSRVMVRYKEQGGDLQDGVIELRRGVSDLDLGSKRYAQVRIACEGTHYMKGMALYGLNMPPGVDIVYNTNKPLGTEMLGPDSANSVLKPMERTKDGSIDMDNPFGATIGAQRGALNIIGSTTKAHEEGAWDQWSRNLSSQFLSKQPEGLAKKQLDITYDLLKKEYDDIMALTNPVVKKKLLMAFADGCDSDAVHLKSAALPRQATKVLLPVVSTNENEVYAPSFNNGETVVLIRHPHGGPFEIPQLTVNNKNPAAIEVLGNAQDAVGINPNVAKKLSGADFDGDTVVVAPNLDGRTVRTRPPLAGIEDFDPIAIYQNKNLPKMSDQTKGNQMGRISNLITDMTLHNAPIDEIGRAVRHSMVVIDAQKHYLDYKQSEIDFGIAGLQQKYQAKPTGSAGGAATLISRAGAEVRIPERRAGAPIGPINPRTGKPTLLYIDPETGAKLYTETGRTYIKRSENKRGIVTEKILPYQTITTRMEQAKDAYELSSGTVMESIYADFANKAKALANQARKDTLTIPRIERSASARVTYAAEVASLNSKIELSKKNAPLERQAQIITRMTVAKKKQDNPDMEPADLKKIRFQALAAARARMGAQREKIEITPREWEAIQANAISNDALVKILDIADMDMIKQYATPRVDSITLSPSQRERAKQMLDGGLMQSEVAENLGVPVNVLVREIYD